MRKMIIDCWSDDDWETVGEASDGNEAVEKYEGLRPNVFTMDIVMPGADGKYALSNYIRV